MFTMIKDVLENNIFFEVQYTCVVDANGVTIKPIKTYNPIKSIMFNYKKGATTIQWIDGTFTVVRCQNGEPFDEEKGIAMCFMKKLFNNKGNYNDFIRDCISNAKLIEAVEETKKEIPSNPILDSRESKSIENKEPSGADEDAIIELDEDELNSIFRSDNCDDDEEESDEFIWTGGPFI